MYFFYAIVSSVVIIIFLLKARQSENYHFVAIYIYIYTYRPKNCHFGAAIYLKTIIETKTLTLSILYVSIAVYTYKNLINRFVLIISISDFSINIIYNYDISVLVFVNLCNEIDRLCK